MCAVTTWYAVQYCYCCYFVIPLPNSIQFSLGFCSEDMRREEGYHINNNNNDNSSNSNNNNRNEHKNLCQRQLINFRLYLLFIFSAMVQDMILLLAVKMQHVNQQQRLKRGSMNTRRTHIRQRERKLCWQL